MTALTDLRIALRTLIKAKGFSAAAVLSLGLGITLCTAVLASVNAYLVRGLPYPGADRLCSVRYAAPGADTPDDLERLNWASLADVIEHPIAWDLDMFYLVGGDHAESAPGAWVTPDFVEGLGVRPALGRSLDASAFVAGSPQVALISHRLWQGRFGGDPNIVGQQVRRLRQRSPGGSRIVHHRRRAAGGLLAHQSVHRHPRAAARADLSIHGAAA